MTEVVDRASSPASPGSTTAAADGSKVAVEPRVDVAALGEQLLGRWADIRLHARDLAGREVVQKVEGLTHTEHRSRVFGQLKYLVDNNAVHRAFPSRLGGSDDHGGNIAGFEELVTADPSLQIKAGVQWGLFGSAVMHLGTREHHDKWLPGIMNLEIPGCFAMTETGHGSDVASIATTATYDEETQEFVIDTPFRAAWKDYIGNAANDGLAAVVFAQLITRKVNHGVHAFYVDLRDPATGDFLPGIGGEDDGIKGGLNGIDNGRLHFTNVRIPRTNLLNRYGDVAVDGTYSSTIESPGRRFFTMLGTLVQGRVSLDGAAVAASKVALQSAIHYAAERRQFNATSPTEEEVLLDYQRHQRRLFTRLATTYAASFAHEQLLQKFDDVFSGAHDTDADRQDLETLAAALKPLSTWHALDTLQECREACGGAGFLIENRFASLRADLDVYVTFEGDNTVLLQLVAKRLLADYAKEFRGANFGVLARYVVDQAAGVALHRTGLRQVAQFVADSGSVQKSALALRDEEGQRTLLTDRVQSMVAEVGAALKGAGKLPQHQAAALFNQHQNELIEAAQAHAELLQWEAFTEALAKVDDAGTKEVLTRLRDLFGLSLIEKHLSWYLMNGRLSMQRGRTVGTYINRLLVKIRPHALDLVDAFGYGAEHLRAAIATGAEATRQDEARTYFRQQRASGSAPADEKTLLAIKAGKSR
ncbi:acyl-CoA dehydrogenase family protein [Arthrobacter sp. TES]|uniref:acyl-CoA dehydrogenase family protein n=1 Tax=Paenarthrobacter ureafaciens TaxID=37931 RepID=UPI000398601E|nr:acyl-CoA dehydrogenase [Paenarthrobacter ureafaciens]AOY71385.1 acyl-CoA dehydrogenase [Arthrobacter sp. ZXY-2]ERI39459.1 acyl-CoA dehydrogenase [Arthrobacter sp. AK-YN10]QOI63249.1 acyl-CoA dehydrogenase family protein [Arthrobacter sp. TES]GLU60339.1 acyl-CoA dehydrogenase [Paenarthrobacter ureafaciens]GLU64589.1 acyl-CoA dehydrogenase [Paenarthrobacter ureafaciens]